MAPDAPGWQLALTGFLTALAAAGIRNFPAVCYWLGRGVGWLTKQPHRLAASAKRRIRRGVQQP